MEVVSTELQQNETKIVGMRLNSCQRSSEIDSMESDNCLPKKG